MEVVIRREKIRTGLIRRIGYATKNKMNKAVKQYVILNNIEDISNSESKRFIIYLHNYEQIYDEYANDSIKYFFSSNILKFLIVFLILIIIVSIVVGIMFS